MKVSKKAFVSFLLAFVCAISAFGQTRILKGTVKSSEGEPLAGVGVFVKGTTNGTTTDIDGKFTLSSVPTNAVVTASSIGYQTAEFNSGTLSSLDIVLHTDDMLLEETVVVGYGSQRKATLTGSVATTTGDALIKNSTVNLSQGLAGRLSGVIVNNRSGEPGRDDAVMYIRGRSTLGDNSPLIIIDGIPGRGDDFSRLTGEEIESVTVLKDASAAIYGSRSANGVILVTTKRGKLEQAPNVTFTYDFGMQQPTRLVKMADAVTYANAYNDQLAITGATPNYNQTQIQHYIDQDDKISYPNTDWFKQIIKPVSTQHKYGVSIDGGGKNVSYFVQFNGQWQDGIYVKSATNYSQYNLRANIDVKVAKRLTLGFSLNARQQHKNYSAFPSDDYGIFYIATRMKPTGAAYFPNGYLRGGSNPAVLVQDLTGYDKTTTNTINATITANWDLGWITKGLSVNGNVAYDLVGSFNKNWKKNWQYYSYDEITETFSERTNSYWPTPTLSQKQTNTSRLTINANLNYDRTFNGHHVSALLGYEQSAYRLDFMNPSINNYASDILDEFFAGSADTSTYKIKGYAKETARRSYFARVGYDFNSKYLIQALVRFDGSENFPKAHRWGVFPGVSVGWRLSEENFIKDNVPSLTNLKLRASYGEQGNDQIDAFQYMTTYEYSTAMRYQMKIDDKPVNFIIPGTIPNENVTWEVARTWNVGLDGSYRNGLLSWELEYFHTRRSNILCTRNASVPYYTGLTNSLPDENIGIVRNQGVELQLSHENRVGSDFRYRLNGNFMYAKNTIEYMDETPWGEGHEYMNLTGHPMGAGLYYQVLGINKTQEDIDNHPQMKGAGLGDFYFEDLDHDGEITNMDRKRCDMTAVPQIVFGLGFDLQWKGLDFSILFQGQGRARFYYAPLTDPVSGNVEMDAAKNAWTLKNPNSDHPRIGSSIVNGGMTPSSYYYKNASFLRLKNVELGYTLDQKIFGPKVPIKGLRFYVAGYNLFTISALKSVDPETSDESYQTYPQMRIFNLGVKLSF